MGRGEDGLFGLGTAVAGGYSPEIAQSLNQMSHQFDEMRRESLALVSQEAQAATSQKLSFVDSSQLRRVGNKNAIVAPRERTSNELSAFTEVRGCRIPDAWQSSEFDIRPPGSLELFIRSYVIAGTIDADNYSSSGRTFRIRNLDEKAEANLELDGKKYTIRPRDSIDMPIPQFPTRLRVEFCGSAATQTGNI